MSPRRPVVGSHRVNLRLAPCLLLSIVLLLPSCGGQDVTADAPSTTDEQVVRPPINVSPPSLPELEIEEQPDGSEIVTLPADPLFETGEWKLKAEAQPPIAQLAEAINQRDATVRLVGHTDGVGAAPDNLELSRRRAETVKSSLIQLGIADQKIETCPLGEAGAPNDQDRPDLRRVEVVLNPSEDACPES